MNAKIKFWMMMLTLVCVSVVGTYIVFAGSGASGTTVGFTYDRPVDSYNDSGRGYAPRWARTFTNDGLGSDYMFAWSHSWTYADQKGQGLTSTNCKLNVRKLCYNCTTVTVLISQNNETFTSTQHGRRRYTGEYISFYSSSDGATSPYGNYTNWQRGLYSNETYCGAGLIDQ